MHDVGAVPGLLTEPQLYSLYEEIIRWARSDPELLWKTLPQELCSIDIAQYEISFRSNCARDPTKTDESAANSLGILTFALLLATAATQVKCFFYTCRFLFHLRTVNF